MFVKVCEAINCTILLLVIDEILVEVSAFPVKAPTTAVEVIEVAPVTTPASIIIVPSRTICCPDNGLISKSVPAVEDMVFPLIVR